MENATRFNTSATPTWCPGCGNFGIQSAIKKALLSLDLEPHKVVISSGIGCSGKMPHWVNVYGFHGLHGRTLPVATGLKLANHNLVVIAEGGDGDGYSEGMGHFIHACRRNVDMTYIVHNNGVYGLTTGQVSPTGDKGFASSTTPHGALEWPLQPLALAISGGANFVARGFSGDAEHLSKLIVEGIQHRGFSFIDVLQVCVSFNPSKSYKWYQQRVYNVADEGHDPTDRTKALEVVFRNDGRLPTGVLYRGSEPAHEKSLPQLTAGALVEQDITDIDVRGLMEELV
jgi:2-oxoglutarate ferredoxin oxidoreductase subunit beta